MRYNWLRQTTVIKSPTDNTPIQLYDILNVNWREFEFSSSQDYTVTKVDVEKPWMISFKLYGTAEYEDLIYLINSVKNPLDLQVGQILKTPPISDIIFYLNSIKQ